MDKGGNKACVEGKSYTTMFTVQAGPQPFPRRKEGGGPG